MGAMPADALAGLNPAQIDAVTAAPGPLLVVAGAGSGKTRVLTHRIAHLVEEEGAEPSSILAITFTTVGGWDKLQTASPKELFGYIGAALAAAVFGVVSKDADKTGAAQKINQ